MGAYSSVLKGQGEQAAAEYKAAQADRAAEYGRLQADLTSTNYREKLNTTLGNIDVIRAAAHIDPSSPTTAAIREREGMISDRQRDAAVLTQRAQAADDDASAEFLRRSGGFSSRMGWLGGGIKVASGLAKGLRGGGGGDEA